MAILALWVSGRGAGFVLEAGQVPTAPLTGVLLLLVGIAVCARARSRNPRQPSQVATAAATLATAVAAVVVWSRSTGRDLALERALSGLPIADTGTPLGRVSLYTAVLIGLLAVALLLPRRGRGATIGTALTSTALAGALVILQGYAIGAPILRDAAAIPVASTTALLVTLLAVATLLLGGPQAWPVRVFVTGTERASLPSRAGFAWLALLISAVIVSSGALWYVGEGRRQEDQAAATLVDLARLKAAEIDRWFRSIHTSAQSIAVTPVAAGGVLRWADDDTGASERRAIAQWLEELREANLLSGVALLTPEGRLVLRTASPVDDRALRLRVRTLPSVDTVIVDDLAREATGAPRLVLWVPLAEDPRAPRPVPGAWLAMVVDPQLELYPTLADAPGEYGDGEFFLWKADGDSARVLSPLRHEGGAVFVALRPMSDFTGPAAALLDTGGTFRGVDYRGIPSVAGIAPVPSARWFVAAKITADVVRGPVRRAALRATFITLLTLLTATALLWALWYRRDLARAQRELGLIAERELTLQAVQRSEERYARALGGTSDGIWEVDLRTQRAFVSERFRTIVGAAPDEPIETSAQIATFFDAEDWAATADVFDRYLRGEAPYQHELRLRRTDSDGIRWVRTRGEVQRDADGTPTLLSGAITDITRERLAEDALRRTDRLLRVRSAVNRTLVRAREESRLLQEVCDIAVHEGGYRMAWIGLAQDDAEKSVRPVAISGEERGYLAANPITWGEDARGQGPTGRCIRTGTPQVAQDLQSERTFGPWRAAATERGYQASASIPLRAEGRVVGALMLYSPDAFAFDREELTLLEELAQDIDFGLSVLRDHVTIERQAQQLELFRLAIERSRDAVFVADVATGRFVDANEAALTQLGYTREEMLRIGPADVVTDIGSRGGLQAVADAVRNAGGLVRPSLHRRKDGSELPVEVGLSVVDLGGRSLILGIARDISDRLRSENERDDLQQQLLRAQKMESVGRLAGGVAHDFNNLLTVINATADLAMAEVAEGTALQGDLRQIRGAGERAAALTRQLLAFSRQQVLRREVLALNEVVSRFLTMLSRVIGEDIHLELKLGADVPPIVADAGQLEQVLMNLCVNARDAMPRGGTLTIGTGIGRIDDEHAARREGMVAGSYAVLSVADTGVGMDKATQAKIFDPFFTTKEVGRGTGLGLSTVYGIVKQTGGSIWVYSELGEGTTFRIYLPIAQGEVANADTAVTDGDGVHTGHETILVVEDEESLRLVARRVLERSGYTVLEATDGGSALAAIADHRGPLDLVLTDLVMPGMSGIELAAELHRTRPELKVIFTSGYSEDVVSDRFHPPGGWNFIAKPYGVQDLAREVRRVLDA